MQDLYQKFESRGIKCGGILLLRAANAIDFIEAARSQHQRVLGIDSFLITETTTQPMEDHILDLSAGTETTDSWSESKQFIEERHNLDFWFEIVV